MRIEIQDFNFDFEIVDNLYFTNDEVKIKANLKNVKFLFQDEEMNFSISHHSNVEYELLSFYNDKNKAIGQFIIDSRVGEFDDKLIREVMEKYVDSRIIKFLLGYLDV
ncbi:hypothetical protein [Neptunitalea lumnitzerae]|nr:hypothetical protein [Neptunitalea sp. Y10]